MSDDFDPKEYWCASMGINTSEAATTENVQHTLERAIEWVMQAVPKTTFTAKFGDGTRITIKYKPRNERCL